MRSTHQRWRRGVIAAWLAVMIMAPAAVARGAEPSIIVSGIWGWVTDRHPAQDLYAPPAADQQSTGGGPSVVEYDASYQRLWVRLTGVHNEPCAGDGCAGVWLLSPLAAESRICRADNSLTTDPASALVGCFDQPGNRVRARFSTVFLAHRGVHGLVAYGEAYQQPDGSMTLDSRHTYSAAGAAPTVLRIQEGLTRLWLPGLMAGSRGNLQLSTSLCRIASRQDVVGGDPGGYILVRCQDFYGRPLDGAFTFLYTEDVGLQGVPNRTGAYLFANRPTTARYTPPAAFSWSSAGGPIIVRRLRTGWYRVTMRAMPLGGAAIVTGVGDGRARCQLGAIERSALPQRVDVRCFTVRGVPVDSRFSLSYVG